MTPKRFLTPAMAVAGSVVATASLTACGSNPINSAIDGAADQLAEQGAEEIVEGMSGGGVDIEFESLPDGFPDEVPLVSTSIVSGVAIPGEDGEEGGFSVNVSDDRDPETVAEAVRNDFADWEQLNWNDALLGGQYTTSDWSVVVAILEGDSESDSVVGYTVIPVAD
ncbi:hypothetical protein [Demequina flava]|uniref:hypothetical protein n=1 Tax=Demequina flava TaxID=1095025 RepID=UPI000781860D|nr:hypothetical protein [Demequina flava]